MAYRNTKSNNYRQTYIEGNVIRKRQAAPEYRPEPRRRTARPKTREEIIRERNIKRAAKRNQQKALSMNLGYVCFLTVATVVCFMVCAAFIHIQSDITARMENIATLESQISSVKADNTAAEKRMETTMNLDEVKKTAKSMGLIYPKKKQIEYYSVENNDYMNQFGDIPSN